MSRRLCGLHPDTGHWVYAIDLDDLKCARCLSGAPSDFGPVEFDDPAQPATPVYTNDELREYHQRRDIRECQT